MARMARVLALTVLLATLPALAGAGPPSPAPGQEEMVDFATEYTKTVMVGIVAGGLLANLVVGGGAATLAGAVAGSTLASWLFISREAQNYVIQRARPEEHQ
jgi:hypothetical protein